MKVTAALILLAALAPSMALAQSPDDAAKAFTYRYKKEVIGYIGGPATPGTEDPADQDDPDESETKPPVCGEFEIKNGLTASSQEPDGSGDCVFSSPSRGTRLLSFDYTTAEQFCASTMNGGGRVAAIERANTSAIRAVGIGVGSFSTTNYRVPGISSITCSVAATPCNNDEFQDGSSCLPKTDLSCGRLKNDSLHFLPAGADIEMASIGSCTFQMPQVTISEGGVSLMAEGQTMRKWVSTLDTFSYKNHGAFISEYGLTGYTEVGFAQWKSGSNIPTVPRIPMEGVDFITIADVGYGSPAELPADLVATPVPSGGTHMEPATSVVIKFKPEVSGDGESQIAGIEFFDSMGFPIEVSRLRYTSDNGTYDVESLSDLRFITSSGESQSKPRSLTVTFSEQVVIGTVAFQAPWGSVAKFPLSFEVFEDKASPTVDDRIFYAGTRQYLESLTVQPGEWVRVLNPVYN